MKRYLFIALVACLLFIGVGSAALTFANFTSASWYVGSTYNNYYPSYSIDRINSTHAEASSATATLRFTPDRNYTLINCSVYLITGAVRNYWFGNTASPTQPLYNGGTGWSTIELSPQLAVGPTDYLYVKNNGTDWYYMNELVCYANDTSVTEYTWQDPVDPYKITVFNGSAGTAVWKAPSYVTSVDYLVVGGGGGGGYEKGGGGGAGGFRNGTFTVTPDGLYIIQLGKGGLGGKSGATAGNRGGDSIFGDLTTNITSTGGGGGGNNGNTNTSTTGGSGGGGGGGSPGGSGSAGNTPSTSPAQGYNGGGGGASSDTSGGGGGAGGNAISSNTTWGGHGGQCAYSSITGTSIAYAAGGGGGVYETSRFPGLGGCGIGGNGQNTSTKAGTGVVNTGSGGGGGGIQAYGGPNGDGGDGSVGVVVLKYVSDSSSVLDVDFTATPSSGPSPLSVSFSDVSIYYNVTADSYSWDFGDGLSSTAHTPTHSYTNPGTYNATFTVTNISMGMSDTAYHTITVTSATGLNTQDLYMTPQYIVTINLINSHGVPILVFSAVDSSGTYQSTTNGSLFFTEPYSVVAYYITADGYRPKAVSYTVDQDEEHTIQMSEYTQSNTSQVQYSATHNVKFTVRGVWEGPIEGAEVTATYVEASGPLEWLYAWIGILTGTDANVQNTTLVGHTGTDGAINFIMVESVQYNVTASYEGKTSKMLIYPKDDDYTLWIDGGMNNTLFFKDSCNPLDVVRVGASGTKINSTAGYLNVSYYDTKNETTSVIIHVNQTHVYGNVTNETLIQSSSFTTVAGDLQDYLIAFNMSKPADQSYVVHVNASTTECGVVKRDFLLTFPPNPITFGIPEPLLIYIAIGFIIFVSLCFVRTMPGETVIAICAIGWATFLMHWWDRETNPVIMAAALSGFTVLAILYNIALRANKQTWW